MKVSYDDPTTWSGIDQLRAAVRYFGSLNEAFNQGFSAEELVRLWLFAVSPEGGEQENEYADAWRLKPQQWKKILTKGTLK